MPFLLENLIIHSFTQLFKGLYKFVCLFNPTFKNLSEGNAYLEDLCGQGFVGAHE
jgi:hypothetical protein